MIDERAEALEEHLRPRLFCITDIEGRLLGSGFAVGGAVMTCAHVLGMRPAAALMAGPHRVLSVTASTVHDVALLDVAADVGGLALSRVRPTDALAAGFPLEPGLTGALFGSARIGGSGAIAYPVGERTYELPEAWTLSDTMVAPGHSGGPVVDRDSGAVAGIMVANFSSDRRLQAPAGFILPLRILLEDAVIGERLRRAEANTPRYGSRPNASAARGWCRAATMAERHRMAEERLFDPQRTVDRPHLKRSMATFLAGEASIWAIVDRSGLGKSTALAALAGQIEDRPVLFMRALEIDAKTEGLDGLVADRLADGRMPFATGIPDLAAIAGAGEAPLVIVDGLNEAQIPLSAMRDQWLPAAVRHAAGCKLVLSCRPEAWDDLKGRLGTNALYRGDDNESAAGGTRIGEFSAEEQQAFVAIAFGAPGGEVSRLRNPLLLGLAAELKEGLDRQQLGQWQLFEEWIRRVCVRAAVASNTSSAVVEGTLERVALACLQQDVRAITRTDPVTREPGFGALMEEHLLVREGTRIGFRYDALFEHLVARSVCIDRLERAGARWRYQGLPIGWPMIVATCQRIAAEEDEASIEAMWDRLDAFDGHGGTGILNCVLALPVSTARQEHVLALLERIAARSRRGFVLSRTDMVDWSWCPAFTRAVLRIAVRAASGYDFRVNDLADEMRFGRSHRQFDFHGFRGIVEALLARDRSAMLATLGLWHDDGTRLGEIWGDLTKESSISSWTSCCFAYCHDLFTDDELLTVPSEANCMAPLQGLALAEPERLLRLAHTLASLPDLPVRRFRSALLSLRAMADKVDEEMGVRFVRASTALGLRRITDVSDDDLANRIVAWCAGDHALRDEAWHHIVRLSALGRGETTALRAFLPYRPDNVLDLARRVPEGFQASSDGVMLDLARSSLFRTEPVDDALALLRIRILVEHIEEHNLSRRHGDVIEDLLHALTPGQAERLGLIDLALRAIRSGTAAGPIVYYAGDQNMMLEPAHRRQADVLAHAFAAECPDLDLVELILHLRLMSNTRDQAEKSDPRIVVDIVQRCRARLGTACVVAELDQVRMFHASGQCRWNAFLARCAQAVDREDFNRAIEDLVYI